MRQTASLIIYRIHTHFKNIALKPHFRKYFQNLAFKKEIIAGNIKAWFHIYSLPSTYAT